MKNLEIGENVVEICTSNVSLIRRYGSFAKGDEFIEYCNYFVVVGGAEIKIEFDKSMKSMFDAFVPFEELDEED